MNLDAFTDITLHRDFIGAVSFMSRGGKRYALKVYRPVHTAEALQGVEIMRYLHQNGFNVPRIFEVEQTVRVSVLYEYVEGVDVYDDREAQIEDLGSMCGRLHSLMRRYEKPLIEHGKPYFADRYLTVISEFKLSPSVLTDFTEYGDELWERMERQPRGFCHGDLHTGNILAKDRRYCVIDFDAAGSAFPLIDAATLCDGSQYFDFNESAYDATTRLLERFLRGYSQHSSLSDGEIAAVYDFIALRHYEIQATIIQVLGRNEFDAEFFEGQHRWLMSWRELCAKKRV